MARINEAIGEGERATIIRFLLVSGIRISEALAIQWKGVDLDSKVLTSWDHKMKRQTEKPNVYPIKAIRLFGLNPKM